MIVPNKLSDLMKLVVRFIYILLLFAFVQMNAQDLPQNFNPEVFKEKIAVHTDRQVYCVNEILHFKAYNLSSKRLRELEWSKVLYIELISYYGKPVFQAKYPFDKFGSTGSVKIPSDILTGSYYLKAYTKWMRNYSPEIYHFQLLTIINPYSDKLLQEPEFYIPGYVSDTFQIITYNLLKIGMDTNAYFRNENIEFTVSKAKISNDKRYTVTINGQDVMLTYDELTKIKNLSLKLDFKDKSDINDFSISVFDKNLFNKNIVRVMPVENSDKFKFEYLPETRGVTLSGSLIDPKTNYPLVFKRINLTILDGNTVCLSVLTDSLGRFYFTLPEIYDSKELFISAEIDHDIKSKILVDNDFCSKLVDLPFVPFEMDHKKWEALNKLSINFIIQHDYSIINTQIDQLDTLINISYYDKPDQVIFFNDYIELPTIEDYFYELVTFAGFRVKDGESYLQVIGPYADLKFYKPLVLFDQIAITDLDKLKRVSPKKINRVEVLNHPYIKGDLTYGGIVNIFSHKGDLAGIDYPSSGLFFNYKMLYSSDYFEPLSKNENPENPKISNTLFWYNGSFNDLTSQKFEFPGGNNTGEYILLIKGIDSSGNEYINTQSILIH